MNGLAVAKQCAIFFKYKSLVSQILVNLAHFLSDWTPSRIPVFSKLSTFIANLTTLTWDEFGFNEKTPDSVQGERLPPSVGVPDRQIHASVSHWRPGRVPCSQSQGCHTTLKLNLRTLNYIRRHPGPIVYRLRINTWDENLAHNQCLPCLDIAVWSKQW